MNEVQGVVDPHIVTAIVCVVLALVAAFAQYVVNLAHQETDLKSK